MRWLAGADGPGPDYCKDCMKLRLASTHCDECPRPGLLPENETAVAWYNRCATQGRFDAGGRLCGIDYVGAESAARLAGLDVTPEDFDKLQILEGETLNIRNERNGNTD